MAKNLVRVLKDHEAIAKNDPFRRIIYNEDRVNFSKAINADDESCFSISGSKLILDHLLQLLGDYTSMIIDFSAIPSSFMNDQKLADFITVYDPNSAFTTDLDKAYNYVYSTLKERDLGIFYHPDFFQTPNSPAFYFSEFSKDVSNDSYNPNRAYPSNNNIDSWPNIKYRETEIKFKNKSFPLSYESFEKSTKSSNKLITCQSRNNTLLQFYNTYFLKENVLTPHSHLLSIPLIGYPGDENENHQYEGLGAVFVYFIKDFSIDKDIKSGKTTKVQRLQSIANDLWFLGLQITFNPVFHIANQLFETARKEATKAAKAAIMSRNMSHNLGSHVMSYLKVHLSSVSSILRDHVLSILLESENLDTLKNHALVADELTLPFLVGIGRFISYLQERQDFIATVSTDFVPFNAKVNFKDFIFDELNCDKRYERHPKNTNFRPDNILLGNIARSEGLGRQTSPTKRDGSMLSNIVLKFRTTFDGSPVERIEYKTKSDDIRIIDPDDYYEDNASIAIAKEELQQMRKYELSLPGGPLGRQAIFSIIENIIRNAAKHGNWREQSQLELTMDIFTKEDVENVHPDEKLKKRLRDDDQADDQSLSLKGVLKRFYCGDYESADNYYFITLTDNLDFTPESLKSIRKALIEGFINEEGRMISTNKGIKEMRISAAWLRSIGDDTLYSPFKAQNVNIEGEDSWTGKTWNGQPPVLYARRSKNAITGACNLQYIFCVMRPLKVAFISPAFEKDHNVFSGTGWYFISLNKYIDLENNYEFVIYDDTVTRNDIKKNEEDETIVSFEDIRRRSSSRFFRLSELIAKATSELESNKSKTDDSEKTYYFQVFNDIKGIALSQPPYDNNKLDNIYLRLYQYLSKWNKGEKIFIDDLKSQNNCNPSEISDYIVYDEPYQEKEKITIYRYVTHLEDKRQFDEYVIKKDPDQKLFKLSEGISGDNSTDRLVRNEAKEELWFYKHLHTMKQKIAIFDERIFSKVSGLDESDFFSHQSSIDINIETVKKELNLSIQNDFVRNMLHYVNTPEEMEDFLKKYHIEPPKQQIKDIEARNYLGATYKFKNLYVFSIISSNESAEQFHLFGIKINPENSQTFSNYVRYATLQWDSNKKRLIINYDANQETAWMKFDSLSIHQGLLDKLYAAFGIKKNDIVAKENLTKDFYEHFIIDALTREIEFKDKNDKQRFFLPGMTIHSGRSKPSEEDMPQQLPFIPYSAIEQAVLDCKYSIVELLDSAHYE